VVVLTKVWQEAALAGPVLRSVDEALEHVHAICFKTGPPRRVGVELEWTLHHVDDPARPLDRAAVRSALGDHAPRTLHPDSPQLPLAHGSYLTVEPGGQVELSTPPHASLATLHAGTEADLRQFGERLARHGLAFGAAGIDAHRRPRRLLHTPRYDAMTAAFARAGPDGSVMMTATAATQVSLDAGTPARLGARWEAVHLLGPVLLAAFANSRHHAGRDTGWASARMRAWLRTDPARTAPVSGAGHPAVAWARYALAAPLLCRRRPAGSWYVPPGITFADWIHGALTPPPRIDDLDYHLGTLFPPVRPRGYVEVRYLDAQPPGEWLAPVAVLTALLADDATVDTARELAAPAAGRWWSAARLGMADPVLRPVARAVLDLACRALDRTDLTAATRATVAEIITRRTAAHEKGVP
jgi:glutamate--cysteine ligase